MMFAAIGLPLLCQAQSTPEPSPAPSTAPPQSAASPAIPKNFDACGGPLELLNKLGNQTPCVFVLGEAAATAQYGSAYIPLNAQINFTLPSGDRTANVSAAARAYGVPGSTLYLGVAPRAEIAITPPSFVQVNSTAESPLTGNSPLAAGATDMTFQYKQLLYVNLKDFAMAGIDLAYRAPTGSPGLRGPGPQYTIDPILFQPLPHNFGVSLTLPVTNSTLVSHTCSQTSAGITCVSEAPERGWALAPELVPYWESSGGTLLALVVQHNFNPNATPIVFSAGQLFGRHFALLAAYGGVTYSASTTGAVQGLVNASATAHPTLFTISANYLFGQSDLPAALQP